MSMARHISTYVDDALKNGDGGRHGTVCTDHRLDAFGCFNILWVWHAYMQQHAVG